MNPGLRACTRIAHSLLTHSRLSLPAQARCLPLLLLPLLLSTAGFATARRSNKTNHTPPPTPKPLPASLPKLYDPNSNMAWRCSGLSNRQLVENLCAARIIQTSRVKDAMLRVDRGLFAPKTEQGQIVAPIAYEDAPVYLGFGATISAPHMHAMALELLADRLQPGNVAMDVGSGSGFLVAAMAEMVAPKKRQTAAAGEEIKTPEQTGAAATGTPASGSAAATAAAGAAAGAPPSAFTAAPSTTPPSEAEGSHQLVFGIEHIDELVKMSQANLKAWDKNYEARISVEKGDGRKGLPGKSFDAIHVGAAAAGIPPALLEQLKPGGRLVIPVGPEGGDQRLEVHDKDASGKINKRVVTGVRYVPLTSEEHQMGQA